VILLLNKFQTKEIINQESSRK